jgi:hypothetical protein
MFLNIGPTTLGRAGPSGTRHEPHRPSRHRCRRRRPVAGLALRGLGQALLEQDRATEARLRFKKALGSFNRALEISPDSVRAHNEKRGLKELLREMEKEAS